MIVKDCKRALVDVHHDSHLRFGDFEFGGPEDAVNSLQLIDQPTSQGSMASDNVAKHILTITSRMKSKIEARRWKFSLRIGRMSSL